MNDVRAELTAIFGEIVALANRAIQLLRNGEGGLDSDYPNGDKPPGTALLAWADLTALKAAIAQQTTGTPFTYDVRTLLTGTAAATATITIVHVSGDDAATEGWSIELSDDLEHPGDNAGAGFFRLRATTTGNSVDTEALPWSWTAAVVSDSLAPSQVTGLSVTPYEGGVTPAFDPSMDLDDGVNPGSLLKEYRVKLGGSLVHTEPATQAISGQPTTYQIGSYSPAPSVSQSGRRYTLQSGGTAFDTAPDQLLLKGWTVSGDFIAKCKVNSISASGTVANAAPAGLQCRESTATGAKHVSLYQLRVSNSQAVEGKKRLTTDGARTNLGKIEGTNTPRWLRMIRQGDTFTLSYSTDGASWTQLAQDTTPMGASVIVGAMTAALTGSGETIAEIDDLVVSPLTSISVDVDTVTGGTWTVEAVDNELNVSTASAGVNADPLPASGAPKMKWNPGPYLRMQEYGTYDSAHITELASISAIKGIVQIYFWGQIETSRGVYDWSRIDTQLAQCAAIGKRLILHIWQHSFGQGELYNGYRVVPAYLQSEPGGEGGSQKGYWIRTNSSGVANNTGIELKSWNTAITDRLLALFQAIGERYNGHPYFEGIRNGESAFRDDAYCNAQRDAGNVGFAGYSYAARKAQYLRLITEVPTYFPNSNVWIALNFGFNGPEMPAICQLMEENRCGLTSPDVYLETESKPVDDRLGNGDRALRGLLTTNGSNWVAGGVDRRTRIPVFHECQGPELGGKETVYDELDTIGEIATFSRNTQGDHHFGPLRKTFTYSAYSNPDTYWDATTEGKQSIKNYYTTGTPVETIQTPPSCYDDYEIVTGGTDPI